MEKVLGLDLGTNSIGWAIREINNSIENQIIDKGVETFDKGVAEDKSGEHPKVQKRTECRGKRRNYQAEKYRKWELLKCLITNSMCPLSIEELNEWRHYKKGVGRKYPQNQRFINWLRFDFDADGKPDFERLGLSKHENCYVFRALIADESKREIFKNEPHIIGRVLYQLVQRRGYNDGQNIDENEIAELSQTIMKGGGKADAAGVNDISPYIERHRTLGAALYYMQKEQNVRIRKRYNLRSHFEAEIKEICRIHDLQHLFQVLWGAIVWQRPLRGQKGLVGICTFEQNKRRCPLSHPLYEEYRTWVFINNLKIKPIADDNTLTEEKEHSRLLNELNDTVYPLFFKASADFKLSSIANALKKKGYEITAKFSEDTKVISFSFLYKMKEIFGEGWEMKTGWNDLLIGESKKQNYTIEDLWHILFDKKDNKKAAETAFDFLKRFGAEKLKLGTKAETFAKIRLQQGYATLSLSAIKKILPYLRQGFIYSEAVYLANLHKVINVKHISEDMARHFAEEFRKIAKQDRFEKKIIQVTNELISYQLNSENRFGMDPNYQLDEDDHKSIEQKLEGCFGKYSWGSLKEDEKQFAMTAVSKKYLAFLQKRIHSRNVFEKTERLHTKIFNWIRDTYNVPDSNIKYLWHPSEQETYLPAIEKDGKRYLRTPEPISKGFKNPMALKTLHKLKKLINYLISIGKIDEDTRVVIEIARELNDTNKRKAIESWQRNREKENDNFRKIIDEINKECNTSFNREDKDIIGKIRLWEEQKRTCVYTGKPIGLCDILNGVKYDYEHTFPASMSFDHELKNLTVADSYYNREIKKKRIPFECPNYTDEYKHNGVTYPPILSTLQTMFGKMIEVEKTVKGKTAKTKEFEKIAHLEKLYVEWKAKKSEDKEIKDNIIIRRHLIRMELDYWRYKLGAFTATEYKAGWRNSQLRDTQTITKYALPFLKTVFNKVDVQKGNITSDFRKIFKIQDRLEKKERKKHSHHAVDAAVLTLIPSAALRDKILLRYNEAIENNLSYHEKPQHWVNFHQQYIIGLEDDVLINYQADHRTLTPTYKTVRKRGKIQFVKEKKQGNQWQYKLDKDGNKIPLIAKGGSIRGQLHKESFYGAIKQEGTLCLVERYPIADFTKIEDCKNIVDKTVRELVKSTLEQRMANGDTFEKAKLKPVPFPSGKAVIKKVRCKVAAGRGYLTPEKSLEIKKHAFLSRHEYKHYVLAQNEENNICLYYEEKIENKVLRSFKIVGLFELAKLNLSKIQEIQNVPYFKTSEVGRGKQKVSITLNHIIKIGAKVLFYKENIDELKEMKKMELSMRLFRVYKFNEISSSEYIYLQNHIEARKNDELGDGDTEWNFEKYQPRLKLISNRFTVAIESKHFEIKPDGEIKWLQ